MLLTACLYERVTRLSETPNCCSSGGDAFFSVTKYHSSSRLPGENPQVLYSCTRSKPALGNLSVQPSPQLKQNTQSIAYDGKTQSNNKKAKPSPCNAPNFASGLFNWESCHCLLWQSFWNWVTLLSVFWYKSFSVRKITPNLMIFSVFILKRGEKMADVWLIIICWFDWIIPCRNYAYHILATQCFIVTRKLHWFRFHFIAKAALYCTLVLL